MSGLRLLFPILLLAGIAEADTKFEFNGQLICDRVPFKYHMTVYELDTFWDNVISPGLPGVYVFSLPHYWEATAQDDNDDVFDLDHWFEIKIRIVHNCTPDQKYKMYDFYMGEFYITGGTHHMTRAIDINNAGEYTTQRPPNKLAKMEEEKLENAFE